MSTCLSEKIHGYFKSLPLLNFQNNYMSQRQFPCHLNIYILLDYALRTKITRCKGGVTKSS